MAVFIHPTAVVDEGAVIGDGTRIWHFSHVMSTARIGRDCNIGQNVFVDAHVSIGNGCKLQNNVSVYRHVCLDDSVFCGPSAVFTNVLNPRAFVRKMDRALPTHVGLGATIGANSTIVCGVSIGRYALIGAASVVTRDVPEYALFYGNPARLRGRVCKCGEKMPPDGICPFCGEKSDGTEYRDELR